MGADKSLLIIALSSRPYIEAAVQAGFTVTAIDAFADQQSCEAAAKVFVVDYDKHGFNAEAVMHLVAGLNANDYCGVIYGSGLESQPEILEAISTRFQLIGNSPKSVADVKNARHFFAALNKLEIPYPEVYFDLNHPVHLLQHQHILHKSAGGTGGTHISYATLSLQAVNLGNDYYQQYLDGIPVSLLFIACNGQVEVVGFNEQWCNPTHTTPFRYGGAVNNLQLSKDIKTQLIRATEKLTNEFNLKGLNSLDAIIQDDITYVLEINPRLSATFDLYHDKANILLRHIDACCAGMLEHVPLAFKTESTARAHAIVYADDDIEISPVFAWPEWATDTPTQVHVATGKLIIKSSYPICTVTAEGRNSEVAKQLAQSRVKILLALLRGSYEAINTPNLLKNSI